MSTLIMMRTCREAVARAVKVLRSAFHHGFRRKKLDPRHLIRDMEELAELSDTVIDQKPVATPELREQLTILAQKALEGWMFLNGGNVQGAYMKLRCFMYGRPDGSFLPGSIVMEEVISQFLQDVGCKESI